MNISLQSVVVTGAASGLGRVVAQSLARESISVICLDLESEKLHNVVAEIKASGGQAQAIATDISKPEQIAAAFEKIAGFDTPLEGIVTCAGVQNRTSILELTADEWDTVMAVNLRGTFLCVQAALRQMMPRDKGRIVTISSDTGKRGGGRVGKSAYGTSKGGVVLFTRSVARELASLAGNIRINCVCPGPMLTPMTGDKYVEGASAPHPVVPIGRYGTTTEVAAGVLFLLSDEASFVYGETMAIDGGLVMD